MGPPSNYFNQIHAQVKDSFYIDINAAHFSKKHVYWRVWVNTKLRLLAFFFRDRISLCSTERPIICYVDLTSLKLRDPPLSVSAGIKDMHHLGLA